jgi:hypothetical protein
MKKFLYPLMLAIFCFTASVSVKAACNSGFSEVIVTIVPDNFPSEISWSLRYAASGALIDTGGSVGDTMCVPTGVCLKFTMYDDFGDGLLSPGYYEVSIDGGVQVHDNGDYNSRTYYINCPPGFNCANPLNVTQGTYTTPHNDTWYMFIADTSGSFILRTDSLGNTCNTRIYVYDHCFGLNYDDGPVGTVFYNDDANGLQSFIDASFAEGDTFFIRIGDAGNSCISANVTWELYYNGPIKGCMDPASCNYNPAATIADTNCVYTGCSGPDLGVDQNQLLNSIMMYNSTWSDPCWVQEGCVMGYGTRNLLAYGVQIWNWGDEPYIVGSQATNPNSFVFDPCHQHYHYMGFAESKLYDMQGNLVDFARKTQYAVFDMQCLPGFMPQNWGAMALSPGCSDIYGAGTACQWVDVTDIDTGNYTLVVGVNSNQLPDFTGNEETDYSNNFTYICIHLYYDLSGNKTFSINTGCPVFVDCAGDTFGLAQRDCAGVCNGSSIRGDVNVDAARDIDDLGEYMSGIADETIPQVICNDLTGDSIITVLDAARLNGCLRSQDSTHYHPYGYGTQHSHCTFPLSIYNFTDTVEIGVANLNQSQRYFDISMRNADCLVLGYEFKIDNVVVDSVVNITGNYSPVITFNPNGHIVVLSEDEFSLNKHLAPLNVLRVYYKSLSDSVICIDEVIDVVNSNYEKTAYLITSCVTATTEPNSVPSLNDVVSMQVVPNPSSGNFQLYLDGTDLSGTTVTIYNSIGEKVLEMPKLDIRSNTTQIDMSSFANGIYHLQVNGKGLSKTIKIVKQ